MPTAQVAPDYLEGLLVVLPGGGAPPAAAVRDAALVAALLHRAAGLQEAPAPRDLRYLLPKPLLALRDPRPAKWAAWVAAEWPSARALPPPAAKSKVLQVGTKHILRNELTIASLFATYIKITFFLFCFYHTILSFMVLLYQPGCE